MQIDTKTTAVSMGGYNPRFSLDAGTPAIVANHFGTLRQKPQTARRPGFVVETACGQQDCVVDTTRTGDGNGGHLWGTDLTEPDRALLEYLKTY